MTNTDTERFVRLRASRGLGQKARTAGHVKGAFEEMRAKYEETYGRAYGSDSPRGWIVEVFGKEVTS